MKFVQLSGTYYCKGCDLVGAILKAVWKPSLETLESQDLDSQSKTSSETFSQIFGKIIKRSQQHPPSHHHHHQIIGGRGQCGFPQRSNCQI